MRIYASCSVGRIIRSVGVTASTVATFERQPIRCFFFRYMQPAGSLCTYQVSRIDTLYSLYMTCCVVIRVYTQLYTNDV